MKLKFDGAAGMVTGSQTRVTHHGYTCVIDCGLYQGPKSIRELNWSSPLESQNVRAIILTHAHIDHSGLVPRWVAAGWKGPIFVTPATAALLKVLLPDAARLQEEDARFANKTHHSRHDPALPLYTETDAFAALRQLHVLDYDIWYQLSPDMSFRYLRAGHILGSACVQIQTMNQNESRVITFSGDVGGGHSELLKEPIRGLETDGLVLESTYGNRRLDLKNRDSQLAELIKKVYERGGTVVIPAFALGRTQDLLLSLFRMKKSQLIPDVPVYLDSPMAREVTHIYTQFVSELRSFELMGEIEQALSPDFFHPIYDPDQSMLLCMSNEPKIVISASGMLQGGRVLHHLKAKLPDSKSAVLFVGYQGSETKGRLLQNGLMNIRIHHQEVAVEAEIVTIEGYSAHADQNDLLNWVASFKRKPQKIFLNHGEPESQKVLAEKLKNELGLNVEVPQLHGIVSF